MNCVVCGSKQTEDERVRGIGLFDEPAFEGIADTREYICEACWCLNNSGKSPRPILIPTSGDH